MAAVGGATSSIMAGNEANREAKAAVELERLNAEIARQEINQQARIRTEEMTRLKETQKMMMLKSGMNLAGSPLLMLEDTKRQLALDLNQLEYKNSMEQYTSSLRQQNYLKSGRAAMIGGYVNAFGKLGSFATNAYSPSTATTGGKV
jgi:hypothetical protein